MIGEGSPSDKAVKTTYRLRASSQPRLDTCLLLPSAYQVFSVEVLSLSSAPSPSPALRILSKLRPAKKFMGYTVVRTRRLPPTALVPLLIFLSHTDVHAGEACLTLPPELGLRIRPNSVSPYHDTVFSLAGCWGKSTSSHTPLPLDQNAVHIIRDWSRTVFDLPQTKLCRFGELNWPTRSSMRPSPLVSNSRSLFALPPSNLPPNVNLPKDQPSS